MSEAPNPGAGEGAAGVQGWHSADHAQLVQAKGWKTADDAIKSYAELEAFRGAPAERLVKLPEKPELADDAWREDLYKRAPYLNPNRAPAKPEDYDVKFEGAPEGFAPELFKIAHKHGLSPEALKDFAEFNSRFGKDLHGKMEAANKLADDNAFKERVGKYEAKFKEKFGEKYAEMNERMRREALRYGFKDEPDLTEFERALALSGRDDALERFWTVMGDIAEVRREAPFHKGGATPVSAEDAKAQLKAKMADPEWGKKALVPGSDEHKERVRLVNAAAGRQLDEAALKKLAGGGSVEIDID